MIVYPNPVNENAADVYFNASSEGYASLQVYDYTRRIDVNRSFACSNGFNDQPLDLSGSKKGAYFIAVSMEGEVLKTTLIKN